MGGICSRRNIAVVRKHRGLFTLIQRQHERPQLLAQSSYELVKLPKIAFPSDHVKDLFHEISREPRTLTLVLTNRQDQFRRVRCADRGVDSRRDADARSNDTATKKRFFRPQAKQKDFE